MFWVEIRLPRPFGGIQAPDGREIRPQSQVIRIPFGDLAMAQQARQQIQVTVTEGDEPRPVRQPPVIRGEVVTDDSDQ